MKPPRKPPRRNQDEDARGRWAALIASGYTSQELLTDAKLLVRLPYSEMFHYVPKTIVDSGGPGFRITGGTYLVGRRPILRNRENWLMAWAVGNAWRNAYWDRFPDDRCDIWDDRRLADILTQDQIAELRSAIIWPPS